MRMTPLKKDIFSSFSHLIGAVFAIIGAVLLIWRAAPDLPLVFVSSVYSFGAIWMLLASGLYHGFKRAENLPSLLRKLDHIGIYFMIAGTFTPLCYVYLNGGLQWGLIIAQWTLVLIGVFLSIFYINLPRMFLTLVFILMGWMAVIPLKQLVMAMSTQSSTLLGIGGIAYTIGAIFYIFKKPNPAPGFFGFHELFHVCIIIGSLLHYMVVLEAIGFAV